MANGTRPPLFEETSEGAKKLNEHFRHIWRNLGIPGDGSLTLIPGVDDVGLLFANAGVFQRKLPFQPYASPYTGSGSAPSDQARRILLWPGTINNGFATNGATELVMPLSQTTLIWAKVSITGSGPVDYASTFIFEIGTTLPDDDEPDTMSGYPPETKYLLLARITTDAKGITAINHLVQQSVGLVIAGELSTSSYGDITRQAYFDL